MKKLIAIASTLGYLGTSAIVFAQERIQIDNPDYGLRSTTPLGTIIGNIITIIIVVAILAVLFMLIWGAFEWITSGGDKEQVGKARNRIVNALIGLVIIAIAFVLVRIIGSIVGINLLDMTLPRLDQ